jgi:glyoxylase-like metal-dependent hydrolase (beta-lactamase superfamily II)
MAVNYRVDVLVQGFPGRSLFHGGMGWSTIALLRGGGRAILVDVGAFGVRGELRKQLRKVGVEPGDITDVVLTHAHYDHSVNFPLFPNATIYIGEHELEWAAAQPPGFDPLPELYVQELVRSPKVRRIKEGEEFLPGLSAIHAPGHTPGHMVFYLQGTDAPIVFTGDAAKNRAELLTRSAHMTYDESVTKRTIERIWEFWRKVPGTLLIPGHDLTMRLDDAGQPEYLGERTAAIEAWFGETLEMTTRLELCACSK